MFFCSDLVVPANTPQSDPVRSSVRVTEGIVRHVWVSWRWGTAGLCGCRLLYAEYQYWPLSMGSWFPSSDYPLDSDESFVIQGDPRQIVLEAYNLDDTFSHRVWVAFSIIRPVYSSSLLQFIEDLELGM